MRKTKIIVLIIVITLFLGGVNERHFQEQANNSVKTKIEAIFNNRKEEIVKQSTPDYSLGQIEVIVSMSKKRYFVVASDRTPILIRYSALNYIFKPKVIILSIDEM